LWQRLDYLSPNRLLVESFLPRGSCEVALSDWLYSEKQGQGAPWNLNWLFPHVKVENSSSRPSRSQPLPLGAKSGMEFANMCYTLVEKFDIQAQNEEKF
jgi:hypothetical protein